MVSVHRTFVPAIEHLESRLVPSSVMLRGRRYSPPPTPQDWYARTFADKAIAAEVRAAHADGVVTKGEVQLIFELADDNGLTAKEVKSLLALPANADYLGLTDPLEYVAERMAWSLAVTTEADAAEPLIAKYLLGTVRPKASGVYVQTDGTLFVDGISYTDIHQGAAPDCGLLAGFAAVALQNPDKVLERFTDNGDGTWFVSFYGGSTVRYWVTVDAWLPTHPDGTQVYAKVVDGELWVALLEKAWFQQEGTRHGYTEPVGIWTYRVTRTLFGLTSKHTGMGATESVVAAALERGGLVYFHSTWTAASPVVNNHVYVAVGYDSATGEWQLFNPWGMPPRRLAVEYPGVVSLTWAEMQGYFE